MRNLKSYFAEYAESHQNPINIKIHMICVPLIAWSVLGFFWTIPFFGTTVAHLLTVAVVIYYAMLGDKKIAALMAVTCLIAWITYMMMLSHLRLISVLVFIFGWIGQFYGHKIEGKKPSFFKDLQFLLIGPAWVLKKLFDPDSSTAEKSVSDKSV